MSNSGIPDINALNLLYTGSVVVFKPVNTVQGTTDFIHNLGYKPAFLIYATPRTEQTPYYQVPYVFVNSNTGSVDFKLDAVATDTTISCYMITQAGGPEYAIQYHYTFYIYLFKQAIQGNA